MRIFSLFAILITSVLFSAFPAHAAGLYLGGGIGGSNIEDGAGNPGGISFDESDTAWKAFVGYRFDIMPIVSVSAEGGYRDLGRPDGSVGGVPVKYDLDGFDYAALAGIGIGPVEVFGRIGGMQYDLKKTIAGVSREFDGHAPVYGVGARMSLFGIGVRAEYEMIDIDELDDVRMISVSALYTF